MPSYQITEPHPSVAKYAYSGRGGAGNYSKAPKTTTGSIATGPASRFEQGLPVSSHKFTSGRGGAGNIRDVSERAIFSFDEELARQASRDSQASNGIYHVGRGGAGNWTSNATPSNSRKDSSSSSGSTRSGFLGRLSHTFERR
ncbi:hypothetical protein GLAREA_05276 [Glarea lozoyensis ATCC 20868]|uniref:Uncharacterized protein n=1 Tax=Glarea lozoyensis (strain ATCC 20868 / MF5171) TaxID=1116229 RepID=S3ECA5_GLAL2|nr:uncharacterized protein GLAREA_05276 [Glarea lozoyensis ATCC 20868]EPE35938.1 hypothetical protein GLAREA_05276 [Glarea lozoyensis ATCC 20868]